MSDLSVAKANLGLDALTAHVLPLLSVGKSSLYTPGLTRGKADYGSLAWKWLIPLARNTAKKC